MQICQQHHAANAGSLQGPNGNDTTTVEGPSALAAQASAGDKAGLVCATHDDEPECGTISNVNGGAEAAPAEGQGDIRSQVRHMMDASLPIARAMQEALKQVDGKEDGAQAWSQRPRKDSTRKRKGGAHRYRWLRVGRTWKKHAL